MGALFYCLARAFVAFLQALPLRAVARLGRAAGAMAWWRDAPMPTVQPVGHRSRGPAHARHGPQWQRLQHGNDKTRQAVKDRAHRKQI